MSVREAQQQVSSREFSEWMAYFQLEPFGELRHDLQAGIVASVIANVNRDPKKRSKPFKPSEFMPDFNADEDQEPMTPEEGLQRIRMLHEMFGVMQGKQITNG